MQNVKTVKIKSKNFWTEIIVIFERDGSKKLNMERYAKMNLNEIELQLHVNNWAKT